MRIAVFLITAALLTSTILVGGAVPCDKTPASRSYVLTIGSTAGGNVTTPGLGSFEYCEGTVIYLIATPQAGYHFAGWTGNVSPISNANRAATSLTIDGSYSITANFEEDPPARYMLAILSAPGGSVVIPGRGTFSYDVGTVVNLVATPAAGYTFLKWSGDVDTVADVNAVSTNITMIGNDSYILICANFKESPRPCGGLHS